MSTEVGIISRILFDGLGIIAPLVLADEGDERPKRDRREDTGPLSSTGVDSRIGLSAVTRRDGRVGLRSELDESSWTKRLDNRYEQ